MENRSESKRAEGWELESRLALAYMKSAEAVKKSRSDNVSVSSRGLSDPVPLEFANYVSRCSDQNPESSRRLPCR